MHFVGNIVSIKNIKEKIIILEILYYGNIIGSINTLNKIKYNSSLKTYINNSSESEKIYFNESEISEIHYTLWCHFCGTRFINLSEKYNFKCWYCNI